MNYKRLIPFLLCCSIGVAAISSAGKADDGGTQEIPEVKAPEVQGFDGEIKEPKALGQQDKQKSEAPFEGGGFQPKDFTCTVSGDKFVCYGTLYRPISGETF